MAKTRSRARLALSISTIAVAVGVSLPSPALAQTAEEPATDEILVTAQRREQSLSDVPMSISAISGTALQDAGIQDIFGVAMQTPSLSVQTSVTPGSVGYRLRNVGNIGNIAAFEPAVSSFVDDIFRARSSFNAGDLVDIDRIETLRGPQSTLYGKNSTAGVVAIYTRRPSDDLEIFAEGSVGGIEGARVEPLARARLKISGPLTSSLRASLSGSWSYHGNLARSDNAVDDREGYGQRRLALRADVVFEPTDRFDVRLIGGVVRDNSAAVNDVTLLTDTPGGTASGYARTSLAGILALQAANAAAGVPNGYRACDDNDPSNFVNCRVGQSDARYRSEEVAIIAKYELAGGHMLSASAAWDQYENGRTDADVLQIRSPAALYEEIEIGSSLQAELRLASPGGETIDWIGGLFLYDSDLRRNPDAERPLMRSDPAALPGILAARALGRTAFPANIIAPGQAVVPNMLLEDRYVGVYGQATWNVSDALSLTAGMRWQRERKRLTQASFTNGIDTPSAAVTGIINVAANGRDGRVDRELTWVVTPQLRLSDKVMIFATAAKGFKAGGYDVGNGGIGPAAREYEDEHVQHYEAGVKASVGGIRLNIAAFRSDWSDFQDAAFLGTVYAVGNAERVRLKGFEIDGTARLAGGLSANFGLTYADLRYVKFTRGQCNPLLTFPVSNPADVAAGAAPQCDLSGARPYRSPPWTTRLGLAWEKDVPWGSVNARADWSWTDRFNTSFSADPRLEQFPLNLVNLRLGTRIDDRDRKFEVIAWVDNLLGEIEHLQDVSVSIFSGDLSYQSYLRPGRSFGLTVRLLQ